MQDNTLLFLLTAGGLALVCLTMIGFVLWIAARLARGPIFSFLGLLARNVDQLDDDDERGTFVHRPTPNLRAIADQHDFDTALAARQMRSGEDPSGVGVRRQSPLGTDQHPRVDLGGDTAAQAIPPPSLRRDRRRSNTRRDRADAEDEIFGGMLDLDSDGDPDL